MGNCSPPFGIGKAWLDKHAGDICDYHDGEWVKRQWKAKFTGDVVAICMLWKRAGLFTLCALGAPLWFIPLGTPYWVWKKYKPKGNTHEQER